MEQKLRIIQVVNVRWFNASAWYGLFLSRLLKDAGHSVLTLGLSGTDSFVKAQDMGLEPVGLPLNDRNPLVLGRLMRDLSALLREAQPHVVNCHRGEGMILWGLLKGMGHSFALVRTRGDQRPPRGNLPNRVLHKGMTDAVIATNSRTRRALIKGLGLAPERVSLVLGGADTRVFLYTEEGRRAVRDELGFADTDLVVGLLGRMDPIKGQRELIQAVRRLRLSGMPDAGRVRLLLAGLPAMYSGKEVFAWLAEAGLSDAVVVTEKRPDVAALISAMDLGVVASLGSEAIARAALEIMACGVPLVGTDVGVMPDLLSSEALVPPGNVPALAALLQKSLSEKEFLAALRREQQKQAASLMEQDFLRETLAVYSKALG